MRPSLLALALLVAGAGCGEFDGNSRTGSGTCSQRGDTPHDPACAVEAGVLARLQAVADDVRGPVSGLVLGVQRADGRVGIVASGTTQRNGGRELVPGDRMPVGSLAKPLVAVLVFQLRDEGALSLDDTLARWQPDYPGAETITVAHLLSHTSGVAEYGEDPDFEARLEAGDTFEPDELVEFAARGEARFAPGTGWSYSNTNYVLLGTVVEATAGEPLHATLRRRIFEPLGMRDSFLQGSEPIPGGLEVHGYLPIGVGRDFDVTDLWNGTAAWASGALVSTAADLLRFSNGLLGGELLPQASLEEMTSPVAEVAEGVFFGYGVGFGEDWIGHDGSVPGWHADWVHHADGTTVVALQNRSGTDQVLQAAMEGARDAL